MNAATGSVTPAYSVIYLVHFPDMDEAAEDGAILTVFRWFWRALGRYWGMSVSESFSPPRGLSWSPFRLPSGERHRVSAWVDDGVLWFGALSAFYLKLLIWVFQKHTVRGQFSWKSMKALLIGALLLVPILVPAIGGMVTAGNMLREYGVCTDSTTGRLGFSP
jgi:hypothetical protein